MINEFKKMSSDDGYLEQMMSNPNTVKQVLDFMAATGSGMRLDRLQKLTASTYPDLVSNILTQNITAKLLEAYYSWNDEWKLWTTQGSSDYLDTQYFERVPQLGMISKMAENGEEFRLIEIPNATQITYTLSPYGDIAMADLRTIRSDRLDYFDTLGDRLGRAVASRLHNTIYVDYLQSNPTLEDSNSLFDTSNHSNDCDSGSAGKALTYDNLVAAFRILDAQTDSSGEPLGAENAYLIVGRYWREIADQIVENPNHPDSANLNVNTIKRRVKKVIYSRKLTYDWYLIADPKELPGLHLDFFEGKQEPQVIPEKADSSFQFEHPGRQRWAIHHYYGPVWKYWQSAVRGSTNTLAS